MPKVPTIPKTIPILSPVLSPPLLPLVRVGADEEVVGDGSGEDEGIIPGGCSAADVEVRAQRKLELEST